MKNTGVILITIRQSVRFVFIILTLTWRQRTEEQT